MPFLKGILEACVERSFISQYLSPSRTVLRAGLAVQSKTDETPALPELDPGEQTNQDVLQNGGDHQPGSSPLLQGPELLFWVTEGGILCAIEVKCTI